jgi:solute carrier family 25 (mitochondrial carrier protein), member 16
MPFTYPFELIRVRMAIETRPHSHRPSPWNAIHTIWTEGRSRGSVTPLSILHFYRGFTVSVLGTVPYRGGIFLIWETLNTHSRDRLSAEILHSHQTQIHLAVGAIAGTVAQVVTYPLEVVRRTQQASGAGSPERMISFRVTIARVWTQAGWRGFFSGLGIGLIKQVPMHSISLATWQIAKQILDV